MDHIFKAIGAIIESFAGMPSDFKILLLACMALGYLHYVCRKEQKTNRDEYKELSEKFAITNSEVARSSESLASAVRELKDVVRFGK